MKHYKFDLFFPFQCQITSCYVLQHWAVRNLLELLTISARQIGVWALQKRGGVVGKLLVFYWLVCFSCEESKRKSLGESWKGL